MLQFIQKYKQRRRLKKLKKQYNDECNDLACYQRSLTVSIRKCNDSLSTALRNTITDSHAECAKLRNRIHAIESFLNKTNKHGGTTEG